MSILVPQMLDAPSKVETEDLSQDVIEVRYRLGTHGSLATSGLHDGATLPHDTSYYIRRSWTTEDRVNGRIGHVIASKFVVWS